MEGMATAQKIRTIIMSYADVHAVPDTGGVIVNQTHLTPNGIPLLRQHLAAAEKKTGVPVLVGTDQEGGAVNRLKNFPPAQAFKFPSPKEMQSMSNEAIAMEGAKVGRLLLLAGVNVLLAPVLDAADPKTLMYEQGRSFGVNPADVTERARQWITGVRQENSQLVVIGKHFPGYNVPGNSDNTEVFDAETLPQEQARSQPFFNTPGLDGVMVNSIQYKAIDPSGPACFSKMIVGQWRARFQDGLIMTDDIAAKGLSISGTARSNARRAFSAGADMLLILDNAKLAEAEQGIADALADPSVSPEERAARQSQLDASVARVVSLALRTRPASV
jgi:beta-N-acetylhexosaminidase